jgi:tetratricopeptide (TPR) repeat protein
VLSEEAFVLVLGLVATGLVALGILEAFLPTRRPRHRSVGGDRWRAGARETDRPAPLAARVGAEAQPGAGSPVGGAGVDGRQAPGTMGPAPVATARPTDAPAAGRAGAEPQSRARAGRRRARTAAPAQGEDAREPAGSAGSPAERCRRLLESHRYADVIAEAQAALSSGPDVGADAARFWGLIGLAREAAGEVEAAREAYRQAITAAPPAERSTWQHHLVTLAAGTGQALLARARNGGEGEDRVQAVRQALEWAEAGLAVAAGDPTLAEIVKAARAALWPAYQEAVAALVHRQEFHAARRLAQEALSDAACPPDAALALRGMMAATFGGEVGQLTAEAIRRLREGSEEEALGTLERAESVLATLPDDSVPPKRRQELERRLWWGFTKLGLRRVETGRLEEAIEPLMRALAFGAVGPERQQETRGPLALALRGVVEAQTAEAERLLRAGDRAGARRLAERLRARLAAATERGLTREELAGALEASETLLERLGRTAP